MRKQYKNSRYYKYNVRNIKDSCKNRMMLCYNYSTNCLNRKVLYE